MTEIDGDKKEERNRSNENKCTGDGFRFAFLKDNCASNTNPTVLDYRETRYARYTRR